MHLIVVSDDLYQKITQKLKIVIIFLACILFAYVHK